MLYGGVGRRGHPFRWGWLPLSERERKVNVVQIKRCTSSVVAVIIQEYITTHTKAHSDRSPASSVRGHLLA